MTLVIELSGSDTATCDGLTAKSNSGPIFKLARDMIAAGRDRATTVVVHRGGTPVFSAAELGWWADRAISEGDKSLRMVKWRPFDRTAFTGAAA